MLYETLSQPLIALYLLLSGLGSGLFFDAGNLVYSIFPKKWFRIFLDIICMLLTGLVFFLVILYVNYGELRLYQVIIFALAVILERLCMRPFFKIKNKINN